MPFFRFFPYFRCGCSTSSDAFWAGWAFCVSPCIAGALANAALAGYSPQVRAAVANAGRMVAELPGSGWGAGAGSIGGEPLRGAGLGGRARCDFLTRTWGALRMSAQAHCHALERAAFAGPITVLYRPARQPWLAGGNARRTQPPWHAGPCPPRWRGAPDDQGLRRGEAVGLLPTRYRPSGLRAWGPFFGKPPHHDAGRRLALQTGAAVLLARCEREPKTGARFVMYAEPCRCQLDADLETNRAPGQRGLGHVIRQCAPVPGAMAAPGRPRAECPSTEVTS